MLSSRAGWRKCEKKVQSTLYFHDRMRIQKTTEARKIDFFTNGRDMEAEMES